MHTDEERCLLFPFTLSDGALNWYCRLPPKTVDSFEELKKLFVSQHIFQTDHLHFADDLYTIRRKPDESLREYVGRFNHEYSRCAEEDDKNTLKAFTAGLRDCFFKYMINANTWKTYWRRLITMPPPKQRHIKGNPYSHPLSARNEWKPYSTK